MAKNQKIRNDRSAKLRPEARHGIVAVVLIALSLLLILTFFSLAGNFGLYLEKFTGLIFGWTGYLLPLILLGLAISLLRADNQQHQPILYFGLGLSLLSLAGFFQLLINYEELALEAGRGGGALGYALFFPLQTIFGYWASLIIILALFIISLIISFNTDLTRLTQIIKPWTWFKRADSAYPVNEQVLNLKNSQTVKVKVPEPKFETKKIAPLATPKPTKTEPVKVSMAEAPAAKKVEVPLNLLEDNHSKPTSNDINQSMLIIQKTLENFGIPVEMGEYNVGPTVTQFSFKPIEGIKLSRIVSLQDNLAMALAAHPIRIEAPIPGKSLVGLEVPNRVIAMVRLKEILTTAVLPKKGALKFALGKDVTGGTWGADLADLPHLLIAGATGSGKSVCINNIIISLLYQKSPDELKMIMVDPKRVELTAYNGIPHLWTPVITDTQKTINALRFLVNEMDRRYKLLEAANKKNIASYNNSVLINKLPHIVLLIDELAELMALAARETEALIVRLAQLSRAVGIHLVLATQRPSVNVITGVIKANLPARVAFAVASQVDSRTILDASGAEKLLGKGDMLYQSASMPKPVRLQGAFISEPEIEKVVDFWKNEAEPEYKDEITEKQTVANLNVPKNSLSNLGANPDDETDPLFEEAKELVLREKQCSATFFQRRLRVGYARAARLLDELEKAKIIGPSNGAKNREIYADASSMGIASESELLAEAEEIANEDFDQEENNNKNEENI